MIQPMSATKGNTSAVGWYSRHIAEDNTTSNIMQHITCSVHHREVDSKDIEGRDQKVARNGQRAVVQ